MYKQYIKQAVQMLRENTLVSIISISGTALAIAMVLVMVLVFQIKSTGYAPESNRSRFMYVWGTEVGSKSPGGSDRNRGGMSSEVVKECFYTLRKPEAVSGYCSDSHSLSLPNRRLFKEYEICYTDAGHWKIFDHPFVEGGPFSEADFQSGIPKMVLSEQVATVKSTMSFLPVITEHPIMPLEESVAQLYIDGYRLLIRAQSLSPSYSMVNKNLVIAYLTIFMQGTAELYKNHSHWTNGIRTRTNEIYRKFIQLVVEHYTTEHSVSFYAAQLNLSLPHFCTTIKKAIGLTPLEIISSIITMDAKAQLRSTDLTVKEIAFSLGFNNLSFFNKYFRQHTGMTPQEYRRMKIPSST